ncbi:glycerate kinase [Nocardioides marmorisolisilvae]|nr:glycerate kinase [Nocardioides marmorisolisilvae]
MAMDKFKGSVTARQACAAVATGVRDVHPRADVVQRPIADGGDGTLEMLLATGYQPRTVACHGVIGEPRSAQVALSGGQVFIELAAVCGLQLLGPVRREPWCASSFGLGSAIRSALDLGAQEVILGLGGSASSDGGLGMLVALGAGVKDGSSQLVSPDTRGVLTAEDLDLSTIDRRLRNVGFIALADVRSPLSGPEGAASVYGPQKGVPSTEVTRLDHALRRWGALLSVRSGRSVDMPGAGAAGGIGAAVLALGGSVIPGAGYLLDRIAIDQILERADLAVTGEGSWDAQSWQGKAPAELLKRASRLNVPAALVAGRIEGTSRPTQVLGSYSLTDLARDEQTSMMQAARLLRRIGSEIGRKHLGPKARPNTPNGRAVMDCEPEASAG